MNWIKQKWLLLVAWMKTMRLVAALKKGEADMDMILGVLRAVLAALGGWLINKGYVDAGQVDALIGAVLVIITGIWSIVAKRKMAQELAMAKANAINLKAAQ